MTKIYLTRHGQDQDNAAGLLNGHRNTPLTDLGLQQAQTLTNFLKNHGPRIDKVYTSPLDRTIQTADIITSGLNLPPAQQLDLLIERDFGLMTGQKIADIDKLCAPDIIKSDTISYFLRPQNGETFPQLLERAGQLFDWLAKNNTADNILLVSHGDFGKMIYAAFYQLDWQEVLHKFHFGNTEVIILDKNSSPAADHKIYQTTQHNA